MKGLVHYSRMGLLNKSFIYILYIYIYISLYTCTAHQWPKNLKYIFWQFCRSSRAIATKVPCTAPKLLSWIPLNSPRWKHQDPTNYQIKKFQHGSNLGFQVRTIKICEFVILQNRIMIPIDIFFQQRGGSTSKPRAVKPKKIAMLAISCNIICNPWFFTMSCWIFWGHLGDFMGPRRIQLPGRCPRHAPFLLGVRMQGLGFDDIGRMGRMGNQSLTWQQVCKNELWKMIPGLVNIEKAIENGHRNSGFTH